jgi:hypothetical protein
MEFDVEKGQFMLTAEKQRLFRADTPEWPLSDVDTLVDHIGLLEQDLANAYPSSLPPQERRQALSEAARMAEIARTARHVLGRHAVLSDDDFSKLLGNG